MNTPQISQFILNSVTKHYFKEVAFGMVRPGQIRREIKQFTADANPNKVHILRFKGHRMLEIPMPGHARRAHVMEQDRKRNRDQINFFCRYVLAKQGKVIPYT